MPPPPPPTAHSQGSKTHTSNDKGKPICWETVYNSRLHEKRRKLITWLIIHTY